MPRHSDPAPSREAALLQGTLDLLILRIVALEPLHGYGIVRRIEQMSGEALQIRQGSLYPALYRMEQRGLLTAGWKTNESGKEAKYYRLVTLPLPQDIVREPELCQRARRRSDHG